MKILINLMLVRAMRETVVVKTIVFHQLKSADQTPNWLIVVGMSNYSFTW